MMEILYNVVSLYVSSQLRSVTSHWWPEISHGGNIFTKKLTNFTNQDFFPFPQQQIVKHLYSAPLNINIKE